MPETTRKKKPEEDEEEEPEKKVLKKPAAAGDDKKPKMKPIDKMLNFSIWGVLVYFCFLGHVFYKLD